MPINLHRLPDEPIIVVTCTAELDTATMREMFGQTVELMGEDEALIYRIVDYHAVTTSFDDVLRAAKEASGDGAPGSTVDPRIKPVMVGGTIWLAEARRAFEGAPFGSVQIPMYSSVADALTAIRREIQTKEE